MNGGEEQTPILARLDRRLPHLYLLFALPLTTLLCFLTAPFFGPDESAQSLRAISLSHGHLIEQMGPKEPGGDMDANVVRVMDGVDDIRFHGRDERLGISSFYEGQQFLYELVKTLSTNP